MAPGSFDEEPDDYFCRECWKEIRDQWHPEHGLQQVTAINRASNLRDEASTSPDSVDIEEIGELINVDDPDVQRHALHALIDVINARPGDALDFLPVLTSRLKNDDILVRCVALYCFADLAETYPRQVTPVADEVVRLLETDTDQGVLEGAIPYVAAVADGDPQSVIDSVPKLTALLQVGTPCEQDAVIALTRIAKVYPESILPVTTELLSYVDKSGSTNRIAALAALGFVAKEYPYVAESAISTVIDLLDADPYRLRANAGGLLADLTDEYPEAIQPAVPRVIELLDDEDEKVRYNATSILAKMAKAYPETVETAVDSLIDALNEE